MADWVRFVKPVRRLRGIGVVERAEQSTTSQLPQHDAIIAALL